MGRILSLVFRWCPIWSKYSFCISIGFEGTLFRTETSSKILWINEQLETQVSLRLSLILMTTLVPGFMAETDRVKLHFRSVNFKFNIFFFAALWGAFIVWTSSYWPSRAVLGLLRTSKNSFVKLKHSLVSMTLRTEDSVLGIKYVLPKLRTWVQIPSTHGRAGHSSALWGGGR